MTFKKLIKNGKVAVIYSPGYGSGWSTWNYDNIAKQLLFDSRIAQKVLDGESISEEWIYGITGKLKSHDYICLLSINELEIEWVPKGQRFEVIEYDGFESVVL